MGSWLLVIGCWLLVILCALGVQVATEFRSLAPQGARMTCYQGKFRDAH